MDRKRLLMGNNNGGFTIPRAGLAAAFDAALGVTSSGGFASAWADQSGNGRNLLQATGANQPIHLPFAGTKYGWLPGVAGNYFSTPDSVAASITGDIDIRCKATMANWATANSLFIGKNNGAGLRSFIFWCLSTGELALQTSADGTTVTTGQSSVVTGISANSTKWVRGTRSASTGFCNFYLSDDGVTWTLLGAANRASTAGGIFDSTTAIEVGSYGAGSTYNFNGKIYRAQIYNGIDGTLAVDFDPSRWSSGTTFTASTGETWTINSTGSKPAQIVDRASLLFDGAAHYMKCAAFTLNQPETVYVVAKHLFWSLGDVVFDGNASNSMLLYGTGVTPNLSMWAGISACSNTGFTVGAVKVGACVFNGASSSSQVNNVAPVTGDVGTGGAGGFTFGAIGAGTSGWQNMQAYEMLVYNVAHDAATRANVIRALMSKHGVS